MSPPPPGLDDLFRHLRREGLAVGSRELLRLEQVFRLAPDLDPEGSGEDELRQILACALVRSPEERQAFETVYGLWWESVEGWWQRARREEPRPRPIPSPLKPSRSGRRRPSGTPRPWGTGRSNRSRPVRRLLAASLVVGAVALAVGVGWDRWRDQRQVAPPPEPQPRTEVAVPEELELMDLGPPPNTYTDWVPRFEVVSAGTVDSLWPRSPLLLGGLLCLGLTAVFWYFYGRNRLPTVTPDPDLPGPARLPLLPLPPSGPELLDPESARSLIWGVDRHVTDVPTTALDLETTASLTARGGGIPRLAFQPESRLRQVWLWVDGAEEDEGLTEYCHEIRTSLEHAGLPVRLGAFDGYPRELSWDEGQAFRPLEVEGHRQTALVAVCTTGDVLLRHLTQAGHDDLPALLRSLGAWPRLTFVDFSRDFSRGRTGLAQVLAPHGVPCVEPEALAAFFGAGRQEVRTPGTGVDLNALRSWAAGLALSPRPVDRPSAYALRRALKLEVSPWAYAQLTEAKIAQGSEAGRAVLAGGQLRWAEEDRRWLLNWLHSTDPATGQDGRLRPGGLLDGALAFWEERLAREEEERRERRDLVQDWPEGAAQLHLRLERALLRLWRDPEGAADDLFELFRAGLGETVRRHLQELIPADAGGSDKEHTRLPWRLNAVQSPRARLRLAELGLAGLRKGTSRRPGRLGLAVGLVAGLGMSLLGTYVGDREAPASNEEITIRDGDRATLPAGTFAYALEPKDARAGQLLYAGTPRQIHVYPERLGPGDEVTVTWTTQEISCRTPLDGAELWRCGSSPESPTTREAADWPRRSLALLLFPSDDEGARTLAAALLDRGSVDALLLGEETRRHLGRLTGPPGAGQEEDQLLIFQGTGDGAASVAFAGPTATLTVTDPGAFLTALEKRDGVDVVETVWDNATVEGQGDVFLANCPYQEAQHPGTGMEFVRVCGGSFEMGAREEDVEADPDERPAHEVRITGFWMGKHEVTRGQYGKWQRTADLSEIPLRSYTKDQDSLPLRNVSWEEARLFCQSLGPVDESEYDLPREAEWEYAARGHTGRLYPWGNEEPDPDRAVYGSDINASPEPVGTKEAGVGPFGTLAQAGNLWGWVVDCYEADLYKRRATGQSLHDPFKETDCRGPLSSYRVLRGGAFWVEPRNLRSANRNWFEPGYRYRSIGFRCVRRPRPEPLDPSAP